MTPNDTANTNLGGLPQLIGISEDRIEDWTVQSLSSNLSTVKFEIWGVATVAALEWQQ